MYQDTYRPPTQFSVFPPVIKNLLILNGLVFLAQMVPSTADMLMRWFALWPLGVPPGYPSFWPWQTITYAFLHGGFTHLLFNMFALWMFGVQIENVWGSRRFSLFYFACVLGAGIVQLIVVTL
ncbi:MAG: rhomboid family intramembrane serine protease, partial [Rhodothermales bacterium]